MTLSCDFSFFKAEKRMNSFYKLLVKESLDREDVDAMEKENIKDCHEIVQMFRQSNGIFHSFLCRTSVQLVIGSCIGLVLIRVVSQSGAVTQSVERPSKVPVWCNSSTGFKSRERHVISSLSYYAAA